MNTLLDGSTVVGALVLLLSVSALGLALGALKLRGVGLSTAGVLFVALFFGHVGAHLDERVPAAAGLLAGATTNTPSLAAAQQALREVGGEAGSAAAANLPGLGYAVAYPFGVLGIILGLVILKAAFRVELPHEGRLLERALKSDSPVPARVTLEVTNPNLAGMPLAKVPALAGTDMSAFPAEGLNLKEKETDHVTA